MHTSFICCKTLSCRRFSNPNEWNNCTENISALNLSNPKWPRLRPDKSSGDQSPFHSSQTEAKSSWNQWEVSHSIKCHVATGIQQETNQKKSKTSYCNSVESIICRFAGTPRQNMCSVIQMQTGLSTSSSASPGIKKITIKKQRTWTSSENPLADEQNAVAKQTSNSMLLANLHNFAKPVPFIPVKFFKAQAASIMVVDFVNCVL